MKNQTRLVVERVFACGLIAITITVSQAEAQPANPPASAVVASPAKSADARLFDPVASVLMHPRCLNCHQINFPRQGDDGVPHAQDVIRGIDGHGAPTLHCAACHQETNTSDNRVPGAPKWGLAPLSMNWDGLNKAQICEQIKDPARNGNRRTGDQVIEHMKDDPLVLWAWNPGGGRTRPPMSHDEFVNVLVTWADAGMPCPK